MFPVKTLWTLDLNNSLTAPPAYDLTRGFFPIEGDRIAAYTLASGEQRWIAPVRTNIAPATGDDLLFVVAPNALMALRADDGSAAWELPFEEPLAVPLVFDNGWLVAVTATGVVLAFRATDGHLLWRCDIGSPAQAVPALAADRVYIPTRDGRVVALRVDTGASVWTRQLGGPPSDILALEERLYVGSTDNFFYCLDAADGHVAWRWRTGADVIGAPLVDGRTVYFVALDNVLRGLNRRSGVQRWKRPLPLRPTAGPLKARETLIVTGLGPTLHAYRMKDGVAAGDVNTSAELGGTPHLIDVSDSQLPLLIVVTRDIAKGATVVALTRSIEPEITSLVPLPNPIPALEKGDGSHFTFLVK